MSVAFLRGLTNEFVRGKVHLSTAAATTMNRKDWALGSFIVGVLALVATIATIFVNGIMNEEARELAGLKPQNAQPVSASGTLSQTPTPSLASATATAANTAPAPPPPTTQAATQPAAAGTEFTVIEEAPPLQQQPQPAQISQHGWEPRPVADETTNGTRYKRSKGSAAKVDGTVRLVFEED